MVEYKVAKGKTVNKSKCLRKELKESSDSWLPSSLISPAEKKNYCDRVDQSMKLGMQVRLAYIAVSEGVPKKLFN